MHKTSHSVDRSPYLSSDNLIKLYSKIPDYSEVKHLGQSEFINALEALKEEFRQCRASLYKEDCINNSSSNSSDIDLITDKTKKVLNIDSQPLFYKRNEYNQNPDRFLGKVSAAASSIHDNHFRRDIGSSSRLDNVGNGSNSRYASTGRKDVHGPPPRDFLSITGCELHRNPYAIHGSNASNYIHYNKPIRSLSFNLVARSNPHQEQQTDSAFQDGYDDDEEDDLGSDGDGSSNSDLSKWSSSPDLTSTKEYEPPKNIEKRLLLRKTHNNSAPSLGQVESENERSQGFKANPVPSHVYKPLYDFIMLKNQRRSLKVREQSKQKLMAQVKPFSFSHDKKISSPCHRNLLSGSGNASQKVAADPMSNTSQSQALNNTKNVRSKKNTPVATLNARKVNYFRANPAPPRTKALLSAMRLKEQQEYRELKKRLRAEALLKNATLPPSMAARDKETKLTHAKLDSMIQEYQNTYNASKDRENNDRSFGAQSSDVETDEDRVSEDSYRNSSGPNKPPGEIKSLFNRSRLKNFTPFGKSRHSSGANGVFECTSNDNLASRLRFQATRKKESERLKREEEELLKLLRNETRRKKLRNSHLQAWRRAHSYSSSQDIALRRQLRMAASILERETFVKEMSSMLTRVRSAPLLLERVKEKTYQPCKKHKDEFLQWTDRSNKSISPRHHAGGYSSVSYNYYPWKSDRFGGGDEQSETVALAEGSLTDSDNEFAGNLCSDSEENFANVAITTTTTKASDYGVKFQEPVENSRKNLTEFKERTSNSN